MKTIRAAIATLPAAGVALLFACGSSFTDVAEHPDAAAGGEAGAADGASSADGAALGCATRPDDPLMCADFDDVPRPLVYSEGTASNVAELPNRAVRAPGVSAPNGMWSDSRTAAGQKLTASGTTDTTHVHVELDVFVEDWGSATVDGALVRVGVQPNQCYVDVRLQSTKLILQTHCVYTDDAADFYASTEVLPNPIVTSKWVHLALDVDYLTATATLSLDGKVKPSLGLNPSAAPGGKPFVDVGEGLDKAVVGFDNVLAFATKK